MSDITLVEGYEPGLIGEAMTLHTTFYVPVWGFGIRFEATLASEMGAFFRRYDRASDLVLAARDTGGGLLGTLVLDGENAGKEAIHLRWFVVAGHVRGRGLGGRLLAHAMDHIDRMTPVPCYLTTFKGLDAARTLYERNGFELVREDATDPWSGTVGLQRFERPPGHALKSPALPPMHRIRD